MAKSPGEYIKEELARRGWTQADLASVLDRPLPTVNRILNGKHAILPDMAIALGTAFENGANEWMARESAYRLSLAGSETDPRVRKRASLYEVAPVKDMEKRGWIRPTKTAGDLESELLRFFQADSVDAIVCPSGATRKSGDQDGLTPSQRAWCHHVRRVASTKLAGKYNETRFDACLAALRRIAAYPQEIHRVPVTLGKFGIRFVVVEPLPGCKVDGFATWLSESEPVIGLSMRFDRIDAFWFTLCHELSHIRHRDDAPVDTNLTDCVTMPMEMRSQAEQRADKESAASLVPPEQLNSFILRVGPLYSRDRIVQFAHKIKMHPGVIVGQLQHRGEVGYHAHRGFLSKVRSILIPAAVTDGWGHRVEIGDKS